MSEAEAQEAYTRLLLEKAEQALTSAGHLITCGDANGAINRLYYACFHALTAGLFHTGRQYVKHAGLRSAMHQHLVRTGVLSDEMGVFYSQLFDSRHAADYDVQITFGLDDARNRVSAARRFVDTMSRLCDSR